MSTIAEEKKLDRRIGRTRRLLREALLELVLEKGYDAVTVEDITARADLGRTTFYLHYKDKEELLMASINDMVDDLVARIARIPISSWNLRRGIDVPGSDPIGEPTPFLLAFRHAAEHADLYRVILRGSANARAMDRLKEIIYHAINEFIEIKTARDNLKLKEKVTVPLEFFTNYLAGSFLGIVTWWLESGLPYTPEQMTDMFQRTFFFGALEVLGNSGEENKE
jgi:AcrR family transcriptional regulator